MGITAQEVEQTATLTNMNQHFISNLETSSSIVPNGRGGYGGDGGSAPAQPPPKPSRR
ncbi:hypothetical protein IFR04_008890 [Cadophora malorum]|uniref:Uncharacterized protein n=1 Tax=Cadophora malorum TaxID=108018 RepID=A0A8H7TFN2_9HELO|nr:hypothetical protein IFR04_008890 [Cadophora malorum]